MAEIVEYFKFIFMNLMNAKVLKSSWMVGLLM